MSQYIISTDRETLEEIEAKISANCKLPNGRGTERWAIPQKMDKEDKWFIRKPPEEGWGDSVERFTQEQMLEGVDFKDSAQEAFKREWRSDKLEESLEPIAEEKKDGK